MARYRKHLPALAHFFGIQAWELERLSIGEINEYLTQLDDYIRIRNG